MSEIAGVSLESLREPIHVALTRYSELSEGRIKFAESASELELTEGKGYSARASGVITHLGLAAGHVTVIAFGHEDGTGNEQLLKQSPHEWNRVSALNYNGLPQRPSSIPRLKRGIHSEALLPLAAVWAHDTSKDPAMFAGSYDEVGLRKTPRKTSSSDSWSLVRIATLGQPRGEYTSSLIGVSQAEPSVTYTVGYLGDNTRFGDPHAIVSPSSDIQLAAFVPLSTIMATDPYNSKLLEHLGARLPKFETVEEA